ncbi:DUF6359 domain-containing protein [Phocaeicola plebeius]|uniref:DUF6359 domain-containing protein n=1 Tax=Phocaeicola plebeius TaxID=310297 RepID=UPI003FEF3E34
MKKIFSALCFALFGVTAIMTSCSDVPAPYDIFENGGQENGPEATVGEGTKESPYDVATAKNNSGKTVWVQGYIVGVMENLYDDAGEFAGNEAKFEAPFTIKTNIIIASDPEETNIKNCLPVKVKGGSDLSNALNLVDHADNLGKLLIIQGTIGSGFGSTSLNETTAAILDGTEIGQEQQGGDETPSGNILFQESFASGQGDFQIKDISKGELDYVWKFDSKYGMKASAYNGKQVAAESWLISPEIDLTNVTTATLTFDHAINQLNGEQPQTNQIVEVSTNNGESWTPLTGITYPEGTSWTFVNAGNVDLKAYAGAKILIGFHYKSTTSSAATWEIKNVKVYSEQTETGGEEVPPIENLIFKETLGTPVSDDTNLSSFSGWDNPNYTYNISYGSKAIRSIAHKTETNLTETNKVNSIWFSKGYDSWFSIEGVNTSGYSKFTVTYEVAANIYNVGETIDLNAIKVSLNDVEVQAPSKIITANTAKNDANIFYTMSVDIEVAGNENSTLKFSVSASDNTVGMRLTNITLQGAEKSETVEPTPEPTPGENDGTEAKPYTVAEAIALNNPGTPAFVKGYIVGAANGSMSKLETSNFTIDTNMLIADTPNETDATQIIPVQLPSGSIRTDWNLKDHPENYQKQVIIEGKLEAYFTQPGLKSAKSITEVQ